MHHATSDKPRQPSQQRYLVVGAGAIGGYFGARMLQAGLDTTFLIRPHHQALLQHHGLIVNSIDGDLTIANPPILTRVTHDDGKKAMPFDVILLCGKSYAMSAMLNDIADMVGQHTVIISLQNGLGNEEQIAARYGAERTAGGVAFIAATRMENGTIQHTSAGRLTLGLWQHDENNPSIKQHFLTACADLALCKFGIQPSNNIREAIWKKLLWNAAFNPTCTLLNLTVDQLLARPQGVELATGIMHEIIDLAAIRGIALNRDLIDQNIAITQKMRAFQPSMLQDYRANRPLELAAICEEPLTIKPIAPQLKTITQLLKIQLHQDQ